MEAHGEQHVPTAAPPLVMAAVLLALLCASLYAGTGAAEFVGDDHLAIVENARVRWRELSLAHVREALAHPDPIVQVSYGLNYRVGRLDSAGYHAVNTAIHAVNALLVFALGRALFRRVRATGASRLSEEAGPWAALAGAALFAAHPLQVEAVTWVAQRGILLATLFGLGAALCWLRFRAAGPRTRPWWLAAVVAGWLLAKHAHEAALALPLAIGLCEWLARFEPPRSVGARRLLFALAVAVSVAVVWIAVRNAPALALHESLLVWPAPARLSLAHDVGGPTLARGGAVALQVLLLGAAFALARRYRVGAFAVLWFLAVHSVEAVFGASPRAAEHHNYFALVGPALGAGHALFAALRHRLGLATALSVFALAALGAATHARNEQWQSAEVLWDDAIAKSPRDATARLERGAERAAQGRIDEAIADLDEAVRLAPDSARAREYLAATLASLHREREALPHAREAVSLAPHSAAAHASLGRILAALGELEPAAAAFAAALQYGDEPGVERSLGDTLVRLRRFEDSLPHYRAAIDRDPGDDDARVGAGAALIELGRARDALAYLEPAVESQPNPRYLVHFADALWQLGDNDGALDAATMAVRVDPTWPGATSRLAWMLALCPDAERRDPTRALRVAEAALHQSAPSIHPSDAAPHPMLLAARAAALAAAGRFAEARADAERAADRAREAGDAALAEAISSQAQSYARRELVRDPPRPFDPSA